MITDSRVDIDSHIRPRLRKAIDQISQIPSFCGRFLLVDLLAAVANDVLHIFGVTN